MHHHRSMLVSFAFVLTIVAPPALANLDALGLQYARQLVASEARALAAALGVSEAVAGEYLTAQFIAEAESRAIIALQNMTDQAGKALYDITKANYTSQWKNSTVLIEAAEVQMKAMAADVAFHGHVAAALRDGVPQLARKGATREAINRSLRAGMLITGLRFLLRVLDVYLVYETGKAAYDAGHSVGATIVKERDLTEALDRQAADTEAYNALIDRMLWASRTGKLKLLPGVKYEDVPLILVSNLERGRPPYERIFEPHKPTNITGPWKGTIHIKDIKGPSNISEEQRKKMIWEVTPANFEIIQEDYYLTLRWMNNRISGYIRNDDTGQLTEKADGTVKWAEFRLFGPQDGSFSGKLQIEFHQVNPQGGTIVRGGLLDKQ